MANKKQRALLKAGVRGWNEWREKEPNESIDLREADFSEANLSWARLGRADLSRAKLGRADLRRADLRGANISQADLKGAYLRGALLGGANLSQTELNEADLRRADLRRAVLSGADLTQADLRDTDLRQANFRGAYLIKAILSKAKLESNNFLTAHVGDTIFVDLDLSESIGLENMFHDGPSTISIGTLTLSKGNLPEVFLKGCGLGDWEIEEVKLYNPELRNDEVNRILYGIYDLRASQALQISPLFVSYSRADNPFVDKIEVRLNEKGVRFWRDIHDMKAGKVETQIDRAITQNRTVLLVLSEHSLKSDWVEHEVRTARGVEKEMERDVLCPVALDESWKSSRWPKRVMEQIREYNILDFSEWQDDGKFDSMFRKLIDGLELFYKG